jgi:hypothetical protein
MAPELALADRQPSPRDVPFVFLDPSSEQKDIRALHPSRARLVGWHGRQVAWLAVSIYSPGGLHSL